MSRRFVQVVLGLTFLHFFRIAISNLQNQRKMRRRKSIISRNRQPAQSIILRKARKRSYRLTGKSLSCLKRMRAMESLRKLRAGRKRSSVFPWSSFLTKILPLSFQIRPETIRISIKDERQSQTIRHVDFVSLAIQFLDQLLGQRVIRL